MNQNWLKSGIYKISSVKYPHKFYIGSAVNLYRRRNRHFSELFARVHFNQKLQRFFDKHGSGSISFEILFLCPRSELLQWEQFFIDNCNPEFNILPTAGSRLGSKHTDETKQKIAESWKHRPPISIISRLLKFKFDS